MSWSQPITGFQANHIHNQSGDFLLRPIEKFEAKTLFKILLPYYEVSFHCYYCCSCCSSSSYYYHGNYNNLLIYLLILKINYLFKCC